MSLLDPSNSGLFDQDSFYKAFKRDLQRAKQYIVIESPFLTLKRVNDLLPILIAANKKNVRIVINTKPLNEHDDLHENIAATCISQLQKVGVLVLQTIGHHRKIALVDGEITWEGSLNILSQNDSCEFMRRITSRENAEQMLVFLNIKQYLR